MTTNVDGRGTLDLPVGIETDVEGVRVRYFHSAIPRIYWSRGMQQALNRETRAFDLIHIHSVFLWPGIAASREARKAGIPYVISPRGMLVPELIAQKSRLSKNLWLRLTGRRDFGAASAIHFTSVLERQDAERLAVPIPHAFVIPNGIDAPEPPAVEREGALLLYLGRITRKKRIDLAIQSLRRVPSARLVIAGNDEEQLVPDLREIAARCGVAARVDFTGPVYGAAKWELLARATLFILQSDSENFGNAVLEALAMGTPVMLSSRVGVADEVVAFGAGVIGSERLEELLSDPVLRAEMGRRGQELVQERFSWKEVAARMENAYRCSI